MKKVLAIVLVLSLVLTLSGTVFAGQDETGNGAPSGYHFTLNIIGVPKVKSADMTYEDGSNRSSIFVKLEGKSRIYLFDGGTFETQAEFRDAFAVLDANGTDGRAEFQLPNPGLDPYVIGGDMTGVDTEADYLIVARPLGKPYGFATMTTCAELVDGTGAGLFALLNKTEQKQIMNATDGAAYVSVQPVPAEFTFRDKGKSKFEDVTAYLTTIVFEIWVDLDGDGEVDEGELFYVRVPIFDPLLENEYWLYDNSNLKLLQLRFYPIPTDITYADTPYLPD